MSEEMTLGGAIIASWRREAALCPRGHRAEYVGLIRVECATCDAQALMQPPLFAIVHDVYDPVTARCGGLACLSRPLFAGLEPCYRIHWAPGVAGPRRPFGTREAAAAFAESYLRLSCSK